MVIDYKKPFLSLAATVTIPQKYVLKLSGDKLLFKEEVVRETVLSSIELNLNGNLVSKKLISIPSYPNFDVTFNSSVGVVYTCSKKGINAVDLNGNLRWHMNLNVSTDENKVTCKFDGKDALIVGFVDAETKQFKIAAIRNGKIVWSF